MDIGLPSFHVLKNFSVKHIHNDWLAAAKLSKNVVNQWQYPMFFVSNQWQHLIVFVSNHGQMTVLFVSNQWQKTSVAVYKSRMLIEI